MYRTPLAWWLMNKWLDDFAYRIDMSWWIFATAGPLLVHCPAHRKFQAIKAALMNPVKNLRMNRRIYVIIDIIRKYDNRILSH